MLKQSFLTLLHRVGWLGWWNMCSILSFIIWCCILSNSVIQGRDPGVITQSVCVSVCAHTILYFSNCVTQGRDPGVITQLMLRSRQRRRFMGHRTAPPPPQSARELDLSICQFVFLFVFGTVAKGSCHLRFSGIRPLRGGGVPPFSAKEKNLLFSDWFSVKGGGGGTPQFR